MQFDTTKLPESQWLTLSEAITYVAFGEAIDKEVLAQTGLAEHQQLLEQCRKEAARNPAYSEFLYLVHHNSPTLAQLVEHQGPMPPSAHPLRALLLTYDRDRAEKDRRLAGAAEKIREAGKDGKLIFRGYKYGQPRGADPQVIDAQDIKFSDPLSWTTEILKVSKHHREWDHVHIERASFVQWLLDSRSDSIEAAARVSSVRERKKRGRPPRYTAECEAAARQIVANRNASPAQFGKTDTAIIDAFRTWYVHKYTNETKPARSTVQDWFTRWGL